MQSCFRALAHSCTCAVIALCSRALVPLRMHHCTHLCRKPKIYHLVYICTCITLCLHTLVQSCPCALVPAHLHTMMQLYFHAFVPAYSCAVMHLCPCTCTTAYIRAFVLLYGCAVVQLCSCTLVRLCGCAGDAG